MGFLGGMMKNGCGAGCLVFFIIILLMGCLAAATGMQIEW
jgi:hypothetical protein